MSRLSMSSKPTALPAASASRNVRISCGAQEARSLARAHVRLCPRLMYEAPLAHELQSQRATAFRGSTIRRKATQHPDPSIYHDHDQAYKGRVLGKGSNVKHLQVIVILHRRIVSQKAYF